MVTLTAYRSFDSKDIYSFIGVTTFAGKYKISLNDPLGSDLMGKANVSVDYAGSFKYSEGVLVSGTLRSATVYANNIKYYEIKGSNDVISYSLYAAGDTNAFLQYVFSGNDIFNGSNSNDYFQFTDSGNDKFFGKAGNDYIATNIRFKSTVDGGDGNDFIVSLGEQDSLRGGKGADIFSIRSLISWDKDVISDFKISDGDALTFGFEGFTDIDYNGDGVFDFNQSSGYFEPYENQICIANGSFVNQDSDDYFIYDLKTGNLYYDYDANGTGYGVGLIVNFSNKPKFTASQIANDVINIYDSTQALEPYAITFFNSNQFGY